MAQTCRPSCSFPLTEQARMALTTNHFTIPSPTPPFRSQLYSAHSGCARAEPRNDSGESADAFREPRASLSHGEASCFQPNISILAIAPQPD